MQGTLYDASLEPYNAMDASAHHRLHRESVGVLRTRIDALTHTARWACCHHEMNVPAASKCQVVKFVHRFNSALATAGYHLVPSNASGSLCLEPVARGLPEKLACAASAVYGLMAAVLGTHKCVSRVVLSSVPVQTAAALVATAVASGRSAIDFLEIRDAPDADVALEAAAQSSGVLPHLRTLRILDLERTAMLPLLAVSPRLEDLEIRLGHTADKATLLTFAAAIVQHGRLRRLTVRNARINPSAIHAMIEAVLIKKTLVHLAVLDGYDCVPLRLAHRVTECLDAGYSSGDQCDKAVDYLCSSSSTLRSSVPVSPRHLFSAFVCGNVPFAPAVANKEDFQCDGSDSGHESIEDEEDEALLPPCSSSSSCFGQVPAAVTLRFPIYAVALGDRRMLRLFAGRGPQVLDKVRVMTRTPNDYVSVDAVTLSLADCRGCCHCSDAPVRVCVTVPLVGVAKLVQRHAEFDHVILDHCAHAALQPPFREAVTSLAARTRRCLHIRHPSDCLDKPVPGLAALLGSYCPAERVRLQGVTCNDGEHSVTEFVMRSGLVSATLSLSCLDLIDLTFAARDNTELRHLEIVHHAALCSTPLQCAARCANVLAMVASNYALWDRACAFVRNPTCYDQEAAGTFRRLQHSFGFCQQHDPRDLASARLRAAVYDLQRTS